MENFPKPAYEPGDEQQQLASNGVIIYPPKFEKKQQPSNIWLKSFVSLALYLFLGYYIFHSFNILLLITAIVIFHELGHFLAMKYFRYSDLGIFFIPLLGAYVSGSKREVSQKESAIILLAGPLPGVILGIISYFIYLGNPETGIAGISLDRVSWLLILLNLLNLLPVYPLDGGQLLNRVFLEEESAISKIFVFLSAALLAWVAWKTEFWILLIFPGMMLLRMFGDSKLNAIEKKIEEEGINLDISYKDLPDKDYWRIRNILIADHSAFKDFNPSPPYEYDPREEKIMTTIESLLHRHLIQDLSIGGKIFILLIWIAALVSPWLMNMERAFAHWLGF